MSCFIGSTQAVAGTWRRWKSTGKTSTTTAVSLLVSDIQVNVTGNDLSHLCFCPMQLCTKWSKGTAVVISLTVRKQTASNKDSRRFRRSSSHPSRHSIWRGITSLSLILLELIATSTWQSSLCDSIGSAGSRTTRLLTFHDWQDCKNFNCSHHSLLTLFLTSGICAGIRSRMLMSTHSTDFTLSKSCTSMTIVSSIFHCKCFQRHHDSSSSIWLRTGFN